MKTCKLTWHQLKQMADNALWAERMYIDLGMIDQACRYGLIHLRIVKALHNLAIKSL